MKPKDIKSVTREEVRNWSEWVIARFANFIYYCYKGELIPPEKEMNRIIGETLVADRLLYFDDKVKTIGMLAIKRADDYAEKKVVEILDICVHPESRSKGISKELRSEMVRREKVDMVIGMANNPISVISRVKLFDELGFVTYWGNEVVGKVKTDEEIDISALSNWVIDQFYPKGILKEGAIAVYSHASIWAKDESMPKEEKLRNVFKKILEFESKHEIPAMATLISVKVK